MIGKEIVISDLRLCTRLHGFKLKMSKNVQGRGSHRTGSTGWRAWVIFAPIYGFTLSGMCQSFPPNSIDILLYTIFYCQPPYTIEADLTRPDPARSGVIDPAWPDPVRRDPTRPDPARLYSTPDSSQYEGRVTRPHYPISTAQSRDQTTPRWNNSRGKPNCGERRKIKDNYL